MKRTIMAICLLWGIQALYSQNRPNIVLLFADDAGYADFGFHGSKEMKTPNLDKLAKSGIRFSQGYVSGSTCGPSRAGLITGKYQQRFGFEENNVPGFMSIASAADGTEMGLPLDEKTMGDYMKSIGYRTAYFGKWHLGGADRFHPTKRGFDEFYGFRGGARSYFAYKTEPKEPMNKLERGFEQFAEPEEYLTDDLAKEASYFIERNKDEPFFAFVAFNAVHTPMEATEADLKQFPELSGRRQQLAAMTLALDRACGIVLDKLKELGLDENTIVVFTNDNGGPSDRNASINLPLSGTKSNQLEGGIRVPFLISWPNKITPGQVYDYPISTLDLLPTFFTAGGGEMAAENDIDGVNLWPYILGENDGRPHQIMYWKKEGRGVYRNENLKFIRFSDRPAELYDISNDISEQNNLATKYPEKIREMYKKLYDWEMTLERPRWLLKRQYEKYDVDRMNQYRNPQR